MSSSVSKIVPLKTRRRIRLAQRTLTRPFIRRRLRTVLQEVRAQAPELPDRNTTDEIIDTWNNSAAADADYLLTVTQLARDSRGPILECGSGLTTIMMAIYATQPVTSLESDAGWQRRLTQEMRWLGVTGPNILYSPLQEHNEFAWYKPPKLSGKATLVVCDGPPRRGKPGGRMGLLPVMNEQLADDVIVVVDRDMQLAEESSMTLWREQYGLDSADQRGSALVISRSRYTH